MYTPETDACCKICLCRQYHLNCTGREHCGIHADIVGTLNGIKRDCEKVFKVDEPKIDQAPKTNAAFEAAARAYNRGEGFIQFNPILGFSCFTYEGHDWDLQSVSQRAYEIR